MKPGALPSAGAECPFCHLTELTAEQLLAHTPLCEAVMDGALTRELVDTLVEITARAVFEVALVVGHKYHETKDREANLAHSAPCCWEVSTCRPG